MFSTIGLFTALVWSLVGAAVAYAIAYFCQPRVEEGPSYARTYRDATHAERSGYGTWAAVITGSILFLVLKLVAYYGMPAVAGPFGGYYVYVLITFGWALLVGHCWAQSGKSFLASAGTGVLLLGYLASVSMYYNLGSANAQKFVGLPNIKVAPKKSTIPPSDPSRLLIVTESIAEFKGQSQLGVLASKYKIGTYDKQAVNGKRYWIAPLTLSNTKDTWNIGNPESTGYVVVDAEDPDAEAQVKTGYHIRLFEDQDWGLYINRFLFVNGFSGGYLVDPKFEVDDNWQPYWVVGYVKPAFGGVAGRTLEKTILVKLTDGVPEITTYDPNNPEERAKHAWVDRVMSKDLVKEYLTDWGYYQGDFAKNNYRDVFFGFDKQGTMQPGDIELCYTKAEENVWVVPMTSTNSTDHAVLGVMVYETNRNEGTWYPEINGFNIGESVKQTMEKARDNIRGYHVEHVQLMMIYDKLTWVGIYTAPQRIGSSFGGIGFLHAHAQNAAEVVFADNKATALERYASQVANHNTAGGSVSQTAEQSKEITGKILRIAPIPAHTGAATWVFKIEGEVMHSFSITRDRYHDIPLVKEGDVITFTYIDTHAKEVPVNSFHCPVLDGNNKPQEKEAQPTPPVPDKN